jgi:hypothetical protein
MAMLAVMSAVTIANMVCLLVRMAAFLLLHHVLQHAHDFAGHRTFVFRHQHRRWSHVHLGHGSLADNVVGLHICGSLCCEDCAEHTQYQQSGEQMHRPHGFLY